MLNDLILIIFVAHPQDDLQTNPEVSVFGNFTIFSSGGDCSRTSTFLLKKRKLGEKNNVSKMTGLILENPDFQ